MDLLSQNFRHYITDVAIIYFLLLYILILKITNLLTWAYLDSDSKSPNIRQAQ